MNIFSKITIFLLFILSFTRCNNPENKIPYVYVDFTIDLDKPEYSDLSIGSYIYVTGGVSGIVIYRDSREVFYAYERACPYDPECGRVEVEDNGYRLVDTCCGSKFSLTLEGAVVQGPAELSLRQYSTYFYPYSNELRVVSQ